ncbi:MAG: twin-arginine translocase TatA/TatE family subunit [Chloroflexota bacterium]
MIEGLFQPAHLLVILLIVLILFGPGKLPDIGRALGDTVREFRRSMREASGEPERTAEEEKRPS